MSPIKHLHSETCMLPVKLHNVERFRWNHPCSHLFGAEQPPRNLKRTYPQLLDNIMHYIGETSNTTNFRQILDIKNEY